MKRISLLLITTCLSASLVYSQKAKVQTAQFYFKKILPRTKGHIEMIDGGAETLMQMTADAFAF